MATIGFIDVLDKIYRSNGDYCKVCFRTSRERRLVTPVFFKRYLKTVNGCRAYKTEIKVCYICEALALSAMKFHRAACLGAELEDLYQQIEAKSLRNVVLNHLNGVMPSTTRFCQRVSHSQTQLRSIQNAVPHSLQCTDTLMVSVDRPPTSKPSTAPGCELTMKTTDEDVTIILDDDRDQAPSVNPHPRVTPTIHNQRMTLSVRNEETNQVVLHPMVIGTDGNVYVPSLKLQILPGNILKSVSDHHLDLHTNTPTTDDSTKNNQHAEKVNNAQKSTAGCDYRTFLKQQNEAATKQNGMQELIHTENMNIVLNFDDESVETNSKKKRYEVDPFSTASNGVTSRNDNISMKVTGDSNSLKKNNDTMEKRPLLSMDRVDWEDKIPMDVISFMDATDPNPEERIMQPAPPREPPPSPPPVPPLGVISDVRTMEEVEVHVLGTVECIDLC